MNIRECIQKAVQENKEITIKYQKYDGTVSTRRISNIKLSDEFGDGYIRAYCHLRNEERTFKISRIIEADGIKNSTSSSSYSSGSYSSTPRYRSSSSGYSYSQPKRKNEGCYIATMAYGDYDHPQVLILRKYRDQVLSSSYLGRKFIHFYYIVSPKLVSILKDHKTANRIIRSMLDKYISIIRYRYF